MSTICGLLQLTTAYALLKSRRTEFPFVHYAASGLSGRENDLEKFRHRFTGR